MQSQRELGGRRRHPRLLRQHQSGEAHEAGGNANQRQKNPKAGGEVVRCGDHGGRKRQTLRFRDTARWGDLPIASEHLPKLLRRLAPPGKRHKSFRELVDELNPKIQGWRNYYLTAYSQKKMAKLDWYILQRLTRWYAKKRQRARWMSALREVKSLSLQYGLKTLL